MLKSYRSYTSRKGTKTRKIILNLISNFPVLTVYIKSLIMIMMIITMISLVTRGLIPLKTVRLRIARTVTMIRNKSKATNRFHSSFKKSLITMATEIILIVIRGILTKVINLKLYKDLIFIRMISISIERR